MEQIKKIVFLEAVQDYGGARISAVELAERLSKKHKVTIIDFYGSCTPFLDNVTKRGRLFSFLSSFEVRTFTGAFIFSKVS